MILAAAPSGHVLRDLRPRTSIPALGLGHRRRRFFSTAHAAARDDETTTEAAQCSAAPGGVSFESQRATKDCSKVAARLPPGSSLRKDYSHTLFQSEFFEVLGLIDLESLRKRPRLTVGVTVKASVVLPVLVVLAALYLTSMAKGVLDWTHLEGEDVGD